ncbi:TIGR03885 family FMN-dependent LLM class oxidoreductase [Protaetiibacter sp. SSC-01]|uniref:TIGR03885 family FMN-dependent LLM class oxidoreductase n=1 Tax=Protaetiibacter sp. SSC-01 TaxID=2759943 RepID=UPI001656BA1E|nr:TIGR03885 family FMN-dependent LLM class oxidoreductase [Protaetiibacter sp. SSC-01]QNO38211.1 TIGR03885 family FMN-dependent LLM class oxidoreductase [Protaetiibacter sp. SSC-01]
MTVVGFHASHEQAPPSELLEAVQRAEEVGFDAAMCSDHWAPWSERQGHSGYSWSWLGAALATTRLPFGVVTAPGQRAHPAIVAQAIATLGELFPGRFWAALGSGENVNEHITGDPWPDKPFRDARLDESADIIRRLLGGETVDADGTVRVHEARLWSVPEVAPRLFGAAIGPQTAARLAGWADGLITAVQEPDALRAVIAAYRDAGGRGPVALQVHYSWAETDDEALAIAHDQWRHGILTPPALWDIATPEEFDRRSDHAAPDDTAGHVFVSSDPEAHLERLLSLAELGFDELYLHHVGRAQEPMLTVFGREVLPALKEGR